MKNEGCAERQAYVLSHQRLLTPNLQMRVHSLDTESRKAKWTIARTGGLGSNRKGNSGVQVIWPGKWESGDSLENGIHTEEGRRRVKENSRA